jgi:hypothetical protein
MKNTRPPVVRSKSHFEQVPVAHVIRQIDDKGNQSTVMPRKAPTSPKAKLPNAKLRQSRLSNLIREPATDKTEPYSIRGSSV